MEHATERTLACLAAYGADQNRWPKEDQICNAHHAGQTAPRGTWLEAEKLDALLAVGQTVPIPTPTFLVRLYGIASTRVIGGNFRQPGFNPSTLSGYERRLIGGFAVAASVCAVIGLIGGWHLGTAAASGDEVWQLGLYLFGGMGGIAL